MHLTSSQQGDLAYEFPELIVADAMLHLALTRDLCHDQGAAIAMFLLRRVLWELKTGRQPCTLPK
jgi:hypothetical protein